MKLRKQVISAFRFSPTQFIQFRLLTLKTHCRVVIVCKFSFFHTICSLDWRSDGWRWKQDGTLKIPHEHEGETWPCKKVYYKTVLPDKSLSGDFKREAYYHPKYPLRVLVVYNGDSSVQVQRPHGNYSIDIIISLES